MGLILKREKEVNRSTESVNPLVFCLVFWENPFTFFFLHLEPPRCPLLFLPLRGENTFSSRFGTIDFQPSSRMSHFPSLSFSPCLSLACSLCKYSYNYPITSFPQSIQSDQIKSNLSAPCRRPAHSHCWHRRKETYVWRKLAVNIMSLIRLTETRHLAERRRKSCQDRT